MKNVLLFFLLLALFVACNEQDKENIEYQIAFAKVYGYVKYFHPSDEAANIDWDNFAIYGAGQVEKCTSEEEFLETLKNLFLPIAPSIQFLSDEDTTSIDLQSITPKDVSEYDLTYWQHKGVSLGMTNNGRPYSSVRVNREFVTDNSSSFGNIMTSLEASKYLGKEFKYTGWVKLEKGSKGTGHLWFRVDKSNSTVGFFDNMGNSPIKEDHWQQYEINGEIDSTAASLAFGCFLQGKGKLLLDDVKLEYKEGENWISVPLENSSFEGNALTDSGQWRHSGSGYTFDISEAERYEGDKSAIIRFEGDFTKGKGIPLFDYHPKFGEMIKKKISQNISCQIPLVLYCNVDNTYPKSINENLPSLKKEVENSTNEATELAVRLGNIINVYNVFQHFYPYLDVITVDWEKELEKALIRCYTDSTQIDHLITLQKFTASLKDGHIRVSSGNMETFVPPIAWEWIENTLVVTAVYDKSLDLAIGDEILQIDGQSATVFFEKIHSKISAGTEGWLNHRAQTESLYGPEDSKVIIKTRDKSVELTRDKDIYQQGLQKAKETYKAINDSVFYLNLDVVPMDTINKLMPELDKFESIICDLRGYPKGNHGFISHLLKTKDTTDGWMQVPQIIYPDQENIVGMEKFSWMLETSMPYLGDKQIIFITDGSAISYAESFMGYIEGYNLATIVGQPTAGTNGNINPFELPGGYRLSWTGMKVSKHDGSQHHAIGVTPDIFLSKTIDGVKAGKDEFLEKAIELTDQKK
jgi:C-terminal processing protease CtpA/Prc